jgi:hypothetical protein
MLLPRFSLRQLLGLITGCSVLFTIASFAVRGQHWAIAVIAGIGSLLVIFGIYALMFIATLALSVLFGAQKSSSLRQSPFADDSPSPRVIDAPADVE